MFHLKQQYILYYMIYVNAKILGFIQVKFVSILQRHKNMQDKETYCYRSVRTSRINNGFPYPTILIV